MSSSVSRRLLYLMAILLYALHNDLWLWDDARLIAGFPVGLAYHILFCVAASVMLSLLVAYAWPEQLADAEQDGEAPREVTR